ncbi:CRL_G0038550.mRNA.1.CDS.1 [Saccharomyces cerevisiae]|nr:CRL_G0038550.mRNA.1.CDS.1 [Saccharomyces cerevisiae]CAI7415122.1 CRL_G0038550.mRNA.1.CDS.1 [Saccharomyces cerevisiae]
MESVPKSNDVEDADVVVCHQRKSSRATLPPRRLTSHLHPLTHPRLERTDQDLLVTRVLSETRPLVEETTDQRMSLTLPPPRSPTPEGPLTATLELVRLTPEEG